MKYFLLATILLLAFISFASGASSNASGIDISNMNATLIKAAYDGSIGQLDPSYKMLIGDNRISIKITGNDSSVEALGLVIKGGDLQEVTEGELKSPTIEINAKESAVVKLQKADDPTAAFDDAIANKDISVKGYGFLNQLKVDALLGNPILPELIIQVLAPPAPQNATA